MFDREKKWKARIRKFEYLERKKNFYDLKKSFLVKINIFHNHLRTIIRWKNEK